MKFFALALTLLVSSSIAYPFENVDIDWSTVRPIAYYPKFWDNKPAELRPPARFFENYERQRQRPDGRIVGGQIAQPHQFPYQAAVLSNIPDQGTGFCGGSLISAQTILTAAHCIDIADAVVAVLGAHFVLNQNEATQLRIGVPQANFRIHPGWNPALIQNDVATLLLPAPVATVPGVIRAAILPSVSDLNYDFAGEDGVVSGWGVYSSATPAISEQLRYAYDNVLTHLACVLSTIGVAQPENICMTGTQNRGACNGDSGGPLTVRRGGDSMQVGIVSFGIAIGGCENTFPSVFVRVTSFLDWINANTV